MTYLAKGLRCGWVSCGGTKAGRGTPRRDEPALTTWEAERDIGIQLRCT
jgi:hypothetical protein